MQALLLVPVQVLLLVPVTVPFEPEPALCGLSELVPQPYEPVQEPLPYEPEPALCGLPELVPTLYEPEPALCWEQPCEVREP